MDICTKICAHYLTHNKVDDVSFEDGQLVLPDIVVTPEEPLQKTRRIIIFQEFSSMAQLLQNVHISKLSFLSFMSDAIYSGSPPIWG